MECPNCGSMRTPVSDGAAWVVEGVVERNRTCRDCGAHFKTLEVAVPKPKRVFGYVRRTALRLKAAAVD